VWTHDQQIDPTTVLGSYTAQSAFRNSCRAAFVQYAVDYDGNGHIDLRTSPADAIASVANYLKQHGWESGRPVVWKIAGDTGSQGNCASSRGWSARAALVARAAHEAGMLMSEPGLNTQRKRARR